MDINFLLVYADYPCGGIVNAVSISYSQSCSNVSTLSVVIIPEIKLIDVAITLPLGSASVHRRLQVFISLVGAYVHYVCR